MRMKSWLITLSFLGCLSNMNYLYAQSTDQNNPLLANPVSGNSTTTTPPAFESDPSKPDATIDVTPAEVNNVPVSAQSNLQWQSYDQPIRHCIAGDIIIPSDGNDIFGFLFNNTAQTDITASIQGWKQGKCAINVSEGTNVMYCRFASGSLREFMNSILMQDQFNRTSTFAESLSEMCQATDPDQQAEAQ